MADIVGSATASIFANVQTPRSSSNASPRSNAVQSTELPDDLRASASSSQRVTVPTGKVPSLLATSIFIGDNIVGMLKSLENVLEVASSSIAGTHTNVLVANGTELSVGNFGTDISRTLDRLTELVGEAEFGGANLLSSTSRDVTLQTTAYGGEINIAPQPLDLQGLGLSDLDLFSSTGLQNALARIDQAIIVAEQRVEGLRALDGAINGTASLTGALNQVNATGQAELRGVLVNLYA